VRLRDGQEVIRNGVSVDRVSIEGAPAVADALCKEEEPRDAVFMGLDVGRLGVGETKCSPLVEALILGLGVVGGDAGSDRVFNKAEVRAKIVSGRRWHGCQGNACGNRVSNKVWSSVSSQRRERISAMTFKVPAICEESER